MKGRFIIEEDTITPYLEKLYEHVSNATNHEKFLKESGQELHFDYIEPLMPKWNPNLMFSPLEPDNQIITSDEVTNRLEVIYTGFTDDAKHGDLEHIFWEFGNPYEGVLERDYAFFQETGIDDVVNPREYRPKHLHFVKKGTAHYQNRYYQRTQAYLMSLLNHKEWQIEDRISRTRYMEDWENEFHDL